MNQEISQKNYSDSTKIPSKGEIFQLGNDTIKKSKKPLTIEEYREMTGDFVSSSEKIQEKIDYLYGFCRNIIKIELKKYVGH
jgi:hypothetical protein